MKCFISKKAQAQNPNDHVQVELQQLEQEIAQQLRFLSSDQLHQIKAIIDANPPGPQNADPVQPAAPVQPQGPAAPLV